ncbi:MAG: energy transducer TonB [Saprospiraceae bacterium]
MSYTKHTFFLFLLLALPVLCFSQKDSTKELNFSVNRIYPYILITKDKLNNASNLSDINPRYEPSWVSSYLSVEMTGTHKGKLIKAFSKNDALSQKQKELLNLVDAGTEISVMVKYIPRNTLKHNDPKEINFEFTVEPEVEAQFLGGKQALRKYLKEKAINQISSASYIKYDLTAVKFTIGTEGEIINAHLFGLEYQDSKNKARNQLLLDAIRNMPCWKPAQYANGVKAQQAFVLLVGNTENCVVNLLNIRRDGRPFGG